jgi:hypothetical protein
MSEGSILDSKPDRKLYVAPSKLDLHGLIVFYHVASGESITAAAG